MEREELSEAPIEALLREARGGDQRAFEELFRRYQPALDAWASRLRFRGHPAGARPSDVAQEAALRAYDRFATFDGNTEAEWLAWLQSVFRSRTVQSIRDARRKKRDVDAVSLDSPEAMAAPSHQKTPSQAAVVKESWRALLACIFDLPDDQREAISLCHLKELPVAEVAKRMRRSEAAVASLLQRGLRALRARLAGGDDGPPTTLTPRSEAADALLTYLRRRDAGAALDAAAFIREHPACADELSSMLHWIDRIQALRPAAPKP